MKKIITAVALLALIFTSSVAISATNRASIQKTSIQNIRQEIVRNISCPDFIETNDPTNQVKAIVSVDDAGKVKVEEINSANSQLKDYVVSQLQGMELKSPTQSQRFVLVINFQVN